MANPDNTGKIGSVTMGIGERILSGEIPELFYSNGQIVYKIKDKDDLILLLDPVTGIVRDVATGFCGAYCYHNQITNSRIETAENLISSNPNVWPEFIGIIASTAITSSESAPGFIESFTAAGLPAEIATTIIGPVLMDGMVLAVIEGNRPELVADAERNGLFNLADYYRNNNALEMQMDVMYQALGMGGPPQGVWDESNEHIRNNENVKRNLQDIKNLKESALAVWNGLYNNLSCPYDRYRYEKAKLEWEEEYDTALSQPPTDPLGQFLVKLVKESVKKCDSGITKIKEGKIVGGAIDLALGTAGFDIVTATIIYEAWPEKPEVPGNNSTNNTGK